MLSTRLRFGSPFSPINWTQPDTHPHLHAASAQYHLRELPSQAIGSMISIHISSNCTHFNKYVYEVHFKKEKEEERKSIIECTYHRTINHALHRDYHKLTAHHLSECSQHRTSMSTCHRISKAHSDASHNLRITPVASLSSPHSSYCPIISHWWKIINVKIKRTTKQLELVHSDVCGPFSTPNSASHRYYILFIDDYTRYTFVWILQDKKSTTCTSAYHIDIKRKRERESEREKARQSDTI